MAEDFKLSSGTWVSVGTLRPDVVAACSSLVYDVVVAGHDRSEIGLLVWPSPAAAQRFTQETDGMAALVRKIAQRLATFNGENRGSSRKIGRFVLLRDPPSLDAGEITDKGYINQRTVLERRFATVADLFAGGPDVTLIA
ncbi:hypothetical protein [Tsuneonella rigui]|uniref:hypothetical protein n=1 Tax=Tsuneonella rigui TaxID=1708790 RepID=UPI0019CF852B|nr:hypothetical protein [Tsuneonella rigui]